MAMEYNSDSSHIPEFFLSEGFISPVRANAISEFVREAVRTLDQDRERTRLYLTQADSLLRTQKSEDRQSASSGALAPWQERKAKKYVKRHLDESIHVSDLAALVGLSTGHFSRAFKQSFGQSPQSYIQLQRVMLAQKYMLETDDCLSRIACTCGFADQSHLCRVFQKYTGSTPLKWRRHYGRFSIASEPTSK